MNEIITIVLAAGKGERLGGPKALLAWPSRPKGEPDLPLCIAHAEARLAAESARVVVVVRNTMVNALLMHARPGIDLLSSTAADELGPAGSLAFAVSRIGAVETAIVTPVDTPPAKAETVKQLIDRAQSEAALLAVRPRYNRRAGHPVLMRAAALVRYGEADPPPLRDHLRSLGPLSQEEDVDDPAVLVDLNTVSDVAAILRAPPRFF